MSQLKPGKLSGDPPGIFSGFKKTYFRFNLMTGTIWAFASKAMWVVVPIAFTTFLFVDRQKWLGLLYERQTWHNREVARAKFAQEEMLEEQSLASSLNNSLPRPLNFTDIQPLTDRAAKKIRNQRIIAENIAFVTHLHGYPVVGVNDARYKTYKVRHQEVKEMEQQHETITNARSQDFINPDASYRKLLNLYSEEKLPEAAKEAFKSRATAELIYQYQNDNANIRYSPFAQLLTIGGSQEDIGVQKLHYYFGRYAKALFD